MARLPMPGGDDGEWGKILNDFLLVEHAPNGTLKKSDAITDAEQTSRKGQQNGYASLDTNAKIPPTQLGTGPATNVTFLRGDRTWAILPTQEEASTSQKGIVQLAGDLGGTASSPLVPALSGKVDKGALVYNVRDYGAIGNGTANDTTAIQHAIDDAESAGGTVFLPAGTYKVILPQVTSGGITIQGAGWKSKLLLADAALAGNGHTIGLWLNGASNVIVKDLAIDGNFDTIAKNGTFASSSTLWDPTIAAYGNSPKTYLYAGSGVDAETYLLYQSCLRITNASNVIVENCYLHNSKSSGILVDGDAVDRTRHIMLRNNRVQLTWDNGIYFHKGVRYGSAIGNHCSDTQYAGITAIYCNDVQITNNLVHDAGPSLSDSAGIEVCAVSNYEIGSNLIYHCLFQGIEIKDSNETAITNGLGGSYVRNYHGQITDNYVHDCNHPGFPAYTAAGINLFGADNTHLSGNKIERCDYGISIGSKNSDVFVNGGNTVRSNRSWGIQVGNSADNFNVQIANNTIENNGSNGVTSFAPLLFTGNIVQNNNGEGVDLAAPPAGLPYKTDYIEGNLFADNLYNGIHAGAGPGNLAVIRNNEFKNSDRLTFYDGITASDAAFGSASANFTADDAGKTITIQNANASDGSALTTTIQSVTNPNSVILTSAPTTSMSNLTFAINRQRQVFYDGEMNGTNALTSGTAEFTAQDVGRSVFMYSSDGPNPSLLGTYTVTAYISAAVVEISASPGVFANRMFVLLRNLGKQERAVYISNGSDIDYQHNRSWCMRRENYPAGLVSKNSTIINNYDFGSPQSNPDPLDGQVLSYMAVNYTSYFGTKDGVRTVDASSGPKEAYLPDTATVSKGAVFSVKKIDSSGNTVTVYGTNSQTIDGAPDYALATARQSVTVISDGTNWQVIGTVQ